MEGLTIGGGGVWAHIAPSHGDPEPSYIVTKQERVRTVRHPVHGESKSTYGWIRAENVEENLRDHITRSENQNGIETLLAIQDGKLCGPLLDQTKDGVAPAYTDEPRRDVDNLTNVVRQYARNGYTAQEIHDRVVFSDGYRCTVEDIQGIMDSRPNASTSR